MHKKTVEIRGLEPRTARKFRRAVRLLRYPSQAQYLLYAVQTLIQQAETIYGLNFEDTQLTPNEHIILQAIKDGAYTEEDLVRETPFTKLSIRATLNALMQSGWLERREKGGLSDAARQRGPKVYLYVAIDHKPLPNLLSVPLLPPVTKK